jgi:hypothetical protein
MPIVMIDSSKTAIGFLIFPTGPMVSPSYAADCADAGHDTAIPK